MKITGPALKRLQVLYRQFEAHSLDAGPTREDRLAWATARVGRQITSFSDLTVEDGIRLIDELQGLVGHKVPSKTPRRRLSRKNAEKAGTEGRRDQIHDETTMASAADIERIQKDLDRLGWDSARLEAFLRSPKSPTRGRTQILTLADANKVHWALKHLQPRKEQRAAS